MAIITDIIGEARRKGISQRTLAGAAGVSEETLSRMKRRGNARLETVEKMAHAAGLHIAVLPNDSSKIPSEATETGAKPGKNASRRFRDKYRTLVWSNPDAPDEVYMRRALLRPDFTILLDAASEFGLQALEKEWNVLMGENSDETRRAAPITERMLKHLRYGYEQAQARFNENAMKAATAGARNPCEGKAS